MRRALAIVAISLALSSACGGGADRTLTAPTSIEPRVGLSDETSAPTLTFVPDTTAPADDSFGITIVPGPQAPGTITLAVSGFNLHNRFPNDGISESGAPVVDHDLFSIQGRLVWNSDLLAFDHQIVGGLLRDDRLTPACCAPRPDAVPYLVAADGPGTVNFFVWRHDNSPGPRRSGDAVLITFRPRAGQRRGESRIDFASSVQEFASLVQMTPYAGSFRRNWFSRINQYYGGTVVVGPGSGGGGAR